MSITIEGSAAPADIETLMQRASEHPEEYGFAREVGSTDFTWEEVARVVDHDGVADGVINEHDADAFVGDGRLSPLQFRTVVFGIFRGLAGRTSAIRVEPCASIDRDVRVLDISLSAALRACDLWGALQLFHVRPSFVNASTACHIANLFP